MSVEVTFAQTFVGLKNYLEILSGEIFWQVLWNTFVFATTGTIGALVLGLAMAVLLNLPELRLRTFWRVLFLMPWTISHVAAGLRWKWIFDTLYGVANDLLLRIGLISEPVLWLASREWAMASVVVANIWRSYPFLMLMFLAGLQAIPKEQYESASVDGATAWQRFCNVTLPNLRFLIFVGTTLEFIFNVRQFDLVYVMTRGGPRNATEVLPTLVSRQAFEYFDYGMAAATSGLMLLILLGFTLIYMRALKIQNTTA
jgi:ABC-type sugar transport system permease subunit